MLTKRSTFRELGGFDEKNFAVAYNDVDYCRRVAKAGSRIVYCGEAELYHHEGFSRPKTDRISEIVALKERYGSDRDAFYSHHLTRRDNQFNIRPVALQPPVREPNLRVLAFSHNLNFEGASNSALELLAQLKDRCDFAVRVVSPVDGPLRAMYESRGISVDILPSRLNAWKARNISEYESILREVASELRMADFHVVYANTARMFWAIDCAGAVGKPSIWNVRESESWKSYYDGFPTVVARRALEAFSKAYRVVFVAEQTRRRWLPIDRLGTFDVIPNALDRERLKEKLASNSRVSARKQLGIADDEVCILNLGTLCTRKGQHDLVAAYSEMSDDVAARVKILLVGARASPYKDAVVELIRKMPPSRQGNISLIDETDDTGRYWSAADIFNCTSRMESYPRVILEAMAAGLPIITTPVNGIPEQVREGENALFANPGDVAQLRTQLETLIADEERRNLFARNSETVLRALTSQSEMVERYEEVFREAAVSSVPLA